MKRAQVRDAIGWMLVAADRYPGLSVRTRNEWRPCSGQGWGPARDPAGPSRAARRAAGGDGTQRTPLRSPLPPLGTATFSHTITFFLLLRSDSSTFPRSHIHFGQYSQFLKFHIQIYAH